jgi:hypothetical protein
MTFRVKQVWTLEERLRIMEEVEKSPSVERIDVATINPKYNYCEEKGDEKAGC